MKKVFLVLLTAMFIALPSAANADANVSVTCNGATFHVTDGSYTLGVYNHGNAATVSVNGPTTITIPIPQNGILSLVRYFDNTGGKEGGGGSQYIKCGTYDDGVPTAPAPTHSSAPVANISKPGIVPAPMTSHNTIRLQSSNKSSSNSEKTTQSASKSDTLEPVSYLPVDHSMPTHTKFVWGLLGLAAVLSGVIIFIEVGKRINSNN